MILSNSNSSFMGPARFVTRYSKPCSHLSDKTSFLKKASKIWQQFCHGSLYSGGPKIFAKYECTRPLDVVVPLLITAPSLKISSAHSAELNLSITGMFAVNLLIIVGIEDIIDFMSQNQSFKFGNREIQYVHSPGSDSKLLTCRDVRKHIPAEGHRDGEMHLFQYHNQLDNRLHQVLLNPYRQQ